MQTLRVLLASSLLLVACGGGSKPAETTPPPAPATQPAPAEPAPVAADPGASRSGIAECDKFIAVAEAFVACEKVPPEARDQVKQALASAEESWAQFKDPSVPPETITEARNACQQGIDGLNQALEASGCPKVE